MLEALRRFALVAAIAALATPAAAPAQRRQPASPLSAWYAVTGWLESPAHLELIEGCFDLAGVGMADDGAGRVYYTLLFVLRARRSPLEGRVAAAPRGRSCR